MRPESPPRELGSDVLFRPGFLVIVLYPSKPMGLQLPCSVESSPKPSQVLMAPSGRDEPHTKAYERIGTTSTAEHFAWPVKFVSIPQGLIVRQYLRIGIRSSRPPISHGSSGLPRWLRYRSHEYHSNIILMGLGSAMPGHGYHGASPQMAQTVLAGYRNLMTSRLVLRWKTMV